MTEALTIAPKTLDSKTLRSSALPIFELPFHLRRRTLMKIRQEEGRVPEKLWNDRANNVEVNAKKIIETQTHLVKSVALNPPSTQWSDLTITFVDGLGVKKGYGEIKSSTQGLGDYKDDIIKDIEEKTGGQLIGPWARELAREQWLVNNNTILMNVGEKDRRERTTGEILYESFYPQFQRIAAESQVLREKLGGLLKEHLHSEHLRSGETKSIQIFP